jgi:MinD-like ATPase involved in chromosome partitioning or flagellar assembly
MTAERYVVLGLAPARAPWFEALAQWSTSAAIAAEFVKCVSAEEVRVRLTSGRRHSALLVDAAAAGFDRDLVDAAVASLTPVVVVRSGRAPSFSGLDLGTAAELPADFGRDQLLDVLSSHCQMIGRGDRLPPVLDLSSAPLWLAQMFAVCGPGGTGASTVAMALAQGLAADARYGRRVLLADLARRADQAMLHDALELGPGLQELVEAHRLGRPDPDEIRRVTFDVPRRGYRLLLGLRQPEAWAALRPRSIEAAIEGLRRSFQAVVADVTGDVEGETEGGSIDVEERNHLARATVLRSAVVVAVGAPGMKGVHSLAGLIRSLARIGVPSERIVAAVDRSPRNPRARAESARALSGLLDGFGLALASPVHVPERKLEDLLRAGDPLPGPIVDPVVRAVIAVAERQSDGAPPSVSPTRIQPGSLGTWTDPEVGAR